VNCEQAVENGENNQGGEDSTFRYQLGLTTLMGSYPQDFVSGVFVGEEGHIVVEKTYL